MKPINKLFTQITKKKLNTFITEKIEKLNF